MNESYLVLQCDIPTQATDWIGTVLADIGCEGVVLETVFEADGPVEATTVSEAMQTVQAYFPEPEDLDLLLGRVHEVLKGLAREYPGCAPAKPRYERVETRDWAEGWKQHFSPICVGPLLIKPSWWEGQVAPVPLELVIDPGMAFGTGTHETTRLCLEILIDSCKAGLPANLLDVGTGSGILAMAAARLGIDKVLGCDNDPVALRVAEENLAANDLRQINLSLAPLSDLAGSFDMVLANILAETNMALASDLVGHLSPGGILVLSGILGSQVTMVRHAFKGYGLEFIERRDQAEWSALVYRQPNGC